MARPNFLWLAAVIASHSGRKVYGRIRLQKTVRLLQACGFETDYLFSIHHYGPYSEELLEDVAELERYGLVEEEPEVTQSGHNVYVVKATQNSKYIPSIEEWRQVIERLEKVDSEILELAATYVEFQGRTGDSRLALKLLKTKKEGKCSRGNLAKMNNLLKSLNLKSY